MASSAQPVNRAQAWRRWPRLATAVVVAAIVAAVAWTALEANVLYGSRLWATDSYFPSEIADSRVVVVGIDRQALAESAAGWPWPRDLQGSLIRALKDAGAELIVVDFVYHPATPADDALAAAIRDAGNVVVASAAELVHREGQRLSEAAVLTEPVPSIAEAAAAAGHANIAPDSVDGVVRAVPLVVDDPDGRFVPSLSLAAVAQLDEAPLSITLRPTGLQLGRRFIPVRDKALLDVNYSATLGAVGRGRQYISAADLLRPGSDRASVRGKIAVVGVADPTLGDQHLTPAAKEGGVPGVFVHANALNTMLENAYLTPAGQTENLLCVFLLALGGGMAVLSGRVWLAAALGLLLAAGYVLVAFQRFGTGHVMDLVYPTAGLVLAWVSALGLRMGAEARERQRMMSVLTQYVPPAVAQQLVGRARSEGLPVGTITFLFTDVVGSTRAWEAWPKAMSQAMRRHDALIEEAVQASGGAVVRPRGEGDSRFGVFVRPPDAASAAADIQRSMAAEAWPTPEPVKIRMALHVGEGELCEGDYYGSPVNRCARIRSLASADQVLISGDMADAVREELPDGTELVDLGMRELKDLSEPEHVFELRLAEKVPLRG